MGNCFALCKPSSGYHHGIISSGMAQKKGKIVRVAKPDGKILEFRTPILVREILENFPALSIAASKEEASSSQPLSMDYELKVGRLYYLLPNLSSCIGNGESEERGSGMKRVKIVITKQQLQQLVNKQISIEDVLSKVQSSRIVDFQSNWKPKLDSIPEGTE